MLEKAMHMNVAEYRPQRIAEMAEFYRFAEAVWNIPEIVPEKIADNSGYIGKHGENVSVYDAMMAEIMDDRNAEKARVRNRRHADRKHPENKAERNKEKQNRMHRLYGLAYEDTKYGKTVYFWDKKEGQKKFPEYEAEIFRNLKERSAEQIARADWDTEKENHAEQMRKIRRMDDMVEGIDEFLESVDEWFMDSDIADWTYEDGELCYGAEDRIEERRLYKDEIGGYMSESRRMYADEEYIRPVFDMGIRADLYLKSLRG